MSALRFQLPKLHGEDQKLFEETQERFRSMLDIIKSEYKERRKAEMPDIQKGDKFMFFRETDSNVMEAIHLRTLWRFTCEDVWNANSMEELCLDFLFDEEERKRWNLACELHVHGGEKWHNKNEEPLKRTRYNTEEPD